MVAKLHQPAERRSPSVGSKAQSFQTGGDLVAAPLNNLGNPAANSGGRS
jgi:hypothetical protein